MLGIMKAGGISVALDVSQPIDRLSSIVRQTRAEWILCTAVTKDIATSISNPGGIVIQIEEEAPRRQAAENLPKVSAEQTVFVTFTSGSTGTPKGACISHANVVAAVRFQGRLLGFPGSTVLDFAPYSFDVAWSNMLHTLCAGGCLCVPKTSDMLRDLASCIDQYNVTLVNITPTMLRMLDRKPSTLRDILLSGEPPSFDLMSRWAGQVSLKNTYGPAECTFKSTFAEVRSDSGSNPASKTIGKGVGAVTWIVDTNEHDHLVPIGEVGELWLEGPLVGQGYLHDAERTAASFVHDPPWLLKDGAGRRGLLYRTGDLVHYLEDGSLVFVGRKDRQVKVQGCRVELGDVEHHLRQSLACRDSVEIAVEAVTPRGCEVATLVAFLTIEETSQLSQKLDKIIPTYMVPSVFVYIPDQIPRTATGKTDRNRLREIANALTLKQLASFNRESPSPGRSICTATEMRLRVYWAQILNIGGESISVEDSFFHLGGNSIRAIQLVGAAREPGLYFTVGEIFEYPKLCDLAGIVRDCDVLATDTIGSCSLLQNIDESQIREKAALACGTEPSNIEDVFACTPFQAGLFALSTQRPGDYVSVRRYTLANTVDLDRFRGAWETVIEAAPILRTRIAHLEENHPVQVVLRRQFQWSETEDAEHQGCTRSIIGYGTPLARFTLVQDLKGCKHGFVWAMHHALFDGFSRAILMSMLERAYSGALVGPSPPFQRFVKHIAHLDIEQASSAWRSYLENCEAPSFPVLPSLDYQPRSDAVVTHSIKSVLWPSDNITPATIIITAWAVVMAEYTSSSDVVMGTIVTGREAQVAGIERMTGPTAATIPFRLKLPDGNLETIEELLCRAQRQRLAMQQFEQMGLAQIRRVSPAAEQACGFQTLLAVQPDETDGCRLLDQEGSEESPYAGSTDGASTYALMISCRLLPDGVQSTINFDPATIDRVGVARMQLQYEAAVRQLSSASARHNSAGSVEVVSHADLKQIQSWNAYVPKTVPKLVHQMLAEVAQQRLDTPAVHAWDGDLSYGQLDDLSTRLAEGLKFALKLVPNDVVPICSEKSLWTSVMVLAVMKTGAASILFDITQPEKRLRKIIAQVRPRAIVASPASLVMATRLALDTKVTSIESLLHKPCPTRNERRPPENSVTVKPSDALFLVSTSGSTGDPKIIVITHENFASALSHQNKSLGFDHKRRVFDFASYAFDAAYYNLLHTLFGGGCLCVPSEDERLNDISGSICRMRATFANLTPKLAELLDVDALRQLQLVELSGETAEVALVARLREHTNVRFAYGPAECSIMSTVSTSDAPVSNIGRGVGVRCWVISCRNLKTLAPVGCVGELWIEGPLVSRGYHGNSDKTDVAFVSDPIWLDKAVGRSGKVYCTGDLVRHTADGSLIFVGRNDNQMKIRGQRVELAEVAHHVQQCLDTVSCVEENGIAVLAEVIRPSGMLVAFVMPPKANLMTVHETIETVALLTATIHQRLSVVVPAYMIPSRFILIQKIPLTATGKVDRQHLRSLAVHDQLNQSYVPCATIPSRKLTRTEMKMRPLWARVLNIDELAIGSETPFWGVGDSITAMSLVVAVRKELGINLKLSLLTKRTTTLGSLSRMIEGEMLEKAILDMGVRQNAQNHSDLQEMIRNLRITARFDARVAAPPPPPGCSIAFLTGSTGFLGTQILHDVLASRRFKKVVVLVRSPDARSGLARVRSAAQAAGWWTEAAARCVEVWQGDLSRPRFDLTAPQWECLAGTGKGEDLIDTVIHNGAAVHWTLDFDSLKATNVDSTFQLLTLAVGSQHLKRFVYVSGGRCFDRPEELNPEDEVSDYVRSKYMSERMVLAMAEHDTQAHGKFAVVKPAWIIGDAETGAANADDFLWRYVRTCVSLRAYPKEASSAWLAIAEVSTVSHEILRQAVAPTAERFRSIEDGLSLGSFWAAVEAASGFTLAEVDATSWLGMVNGDISRQGETHPLWPVQHHIGMLGVVRSSSLGRGLSQTASEVKARLR